MTRRSAQWLWGLKLLVGGTLLVWLILSVDSIALLQRLSQVNPWWLAFVFIVPHVGILICCLKWRLLLRARGGRAGLWELFRLYLVGTFFNNFFPSMVGGDVVRAYELGKAEQNAALAVASIFMERYTGFAALVSMMPLALLLPGVHETFPGLALFIVVVVGAFIGGSWLLFRGGGEAPRALGKDAGLWGRVLGVVRRSHWHIASFRGHADVLAASYALSVLFYLSAGLTVWLATRSVDATLSLTAAVCLTPLVLFAGAIPVSINGLGVIELGYVVSMGLVGVPEVDALSAAVLLRIRLLFTTAVGGVVYMASRGPVNRPLSDPATRDNGTSQGVAQALDSDRS